MGRFFNLKMMSLKRIPVGLPKKNNPFEKMREEFNKETYAEPIRSETDAESGGALIARREDPVTVLPAEDKAKSSGQKRTRRTNKSKSRKTRSDKGVRRPVDSFKV